MTGQAGASWPTLAVDATNTSYCRDVTGPKSSPSVQWSFDWDEDISFTCQPAVANETIYVGADMGNLYALDAETGELQWTFYSPEPKIETPTIANGRVYVANNGLVPIPTEAGTIGGRSGPSPSIHALDPSSGDVVAESEVGLGDTRSSPTVTDDGVFCLYSDDLYDGRLRCFDPESLEINWTLELQDAALAQPAVDGGILFIGDATHRAHALDTLSGEELWVTDTELLSEWSMPQHSAGVGQPLVVYDELVFAVDGNKNLYALDKHTGEEQWRFVRSAHSALAVDGDRVYVQNEDDFAELAALDMTTGETDWKCKFGQEIVASPTCCEDTVYVVNSSTPSEPHRSGTLHAVVSESGEERWSVEFDGTPSSAPCICPEGILVTSDEGVQLIGS